MHKYIKIIHRFTKRCINRNRGIDMLLSKFIYEDNLVKCMEKSKLIKILQYNYNDDAPLQVNNENWTLVDLYLRQYLNNGGDGFGMVNVEQIFNLLCKNKQLLIDNTMVNEVSWNNSRYLLWDKYNFDLCYQEHEKGINY